MARGIEEEAEGPERRREFLGLLEWSLAPDSASTASPVAVERRGRSATASLGSREAPDTKENAPWTRLTAGGSPSEMFFG